MSDNGSAFFNAPKAGRNAAFHFDNELTASADPPPGLTAEINGDQSSRLHPTPAVLDNSQKVGNPQMEPAPESTMAEYSGRQPAGPDTSTHPLGQGRP